MITGDLGDVTVADLVQFMSIGQKSGTLRILGEKEGAVLGFFEGDVINARLDSQPRLGQALIENGLATEVQVVEAIMEQQGASDYRNIGDWLVRRGVVTEATIAKVVSQTTMEAASALLKWTSGTFEFETGSPPGFSDNHQGDHDPRIAHGKVRSEGILMEAARLMDESRRHEDGASGELADGLETPLPAPPVTEETAATMPVSAASSNLGDVAATMSLPGRHVEEDKPTSSSIFTEILPTLIQTFSRCEEDACAIATRDTDQLAESALNLDNSVHPSSWGPPNSTSFKISTSIHEPSTVARTRGLGAAREATNPQDFLVSSSAPFGRSCEPAGGHLALGRGPPHLSLAPDLGETVMHGSASQAVEEDPNH